MRYAQVMKKPTLLCPVDFSESTELAISIAVGLAKSGEMKLLLLHVIDPDVPAMTMHQASDQQLLQRLRTEYLDLHKVDWEQVNRRGDPAETTIAYAKQTEASLIVMGTHGRTGLASIVVGSVARKVMAGAPCPVVTVKTPSHFKGRSWEDAVIPMRVPT